MPFGPECHSVWSVDRPSRLTGFISWLVTVSGFQGSSCGGQSPYLRFHPPRATETFLAARRYISDSPQQCQQVSVKILANDPRGSRLPSKAPESEPRTTPPAEGLSGTRGYSTRTLPPWQEPVLPAFGEVFIPTCRRRESGASRVGRSRAQTFSEAPRAERIGACPPG
jgi:hypothetical protein